MNFYKICCIKRFFRVLPIGVILAILISSLFHKCANIVPPTGGLKDTIPPRIISSNPPLYSTEVTPSRITIVFDEFIELKNLQQQFLISPPQEERPKITQRGKILTIDFLSELAQNTTYSLNFGNSLVDLNEGNPFGNFEFVFSTGKSIDSLTISGKVVSALENKPEENIIIMLYLNHADSVPMKEIPLYVTRTDKEGNFKLRHLGAETYKMVALKDINNNFLYDSPGNEAIAFLDSLIYPTGFDFISVQPTDSVDTEHEHEGEHEHEHKLETEPSLIEARDSVNHKDIVLRLFTEDASRQYIGSATRPERNRLFFTLNKPSQKTPEITPLNFSLEMPWKITEAFPGNDSVIVWITDSIVQKKDTIQLAVEFFDFRPDSVISIIDSLRFSFADSRERTRQQGIQTGTDQLAAINVRNGEVLDLFKKISFSLRRPVSLIDTTKISLVQIIDSLSSPVDFKLVQNPSYPRRFELDVKLEEDNEYSLISLPGTFTDIYGNTSDTIRTDFKTQKETNYGSLILTLTGVDENLIIQLMDEKDVVLKEDFISENTILEYKFMKPLKYKLRAVFDSNNNRKWDTGDYLLGIQPEQVIMMKEIITIRAAWELELTWEIIDK
jgi:hypothetical protein